RRRSADDSPALRELLAAILEQSLAFDVIAQASDGRQAIQLAASHLPDLVIIDIAMPGMSGLDAIPEISKRSPRSKIVVLSGMDPDAMSAKALARGADGFVPKGLRAEDLVDRISGAYEAAIA